jgi:hypothetical protein
MSSLIGGDLPIDPELTLPPNAAGEPSDSMISSAREVSLNRCLAQKATGMLVLGLANLRTSRTEMCKDRGKHVLGGLNRDFQFDLRQRRCPRVHVFSFEGCFELPCGASA